MFQGLPKISFFIKGHRIVEFRQIWKIFPHLGRDLAGEYLKSAHFKGLWRWRGNGNSLFRTKTLKVS